MGKPWSEFDLRMLENLKSMKCCLENHVAEANWLIVKLKSKYEFTEQELVKQNGNY